MRRATMRASVTLLFCSMLAACSSGVQMPPVVYTPPSMPSLTATSEGIKKAATEAKLIDPIEISDLRQSDHGPGRFYLCIRGVDSKYRRIRTYAVFFDNDEYKGLRSSVMIDDCEKQEYRPFP